MKTKNFPSVIKARKIVHKQFEHYREIMEGPSTMKIVKGNLIDLAEQGEFNIIVQGCNCWCAMGGGLAKEIRVRYPAAVAADNAFSFAGDYNKLGNYSTMLGKGFNIINAYTQFNMSNGEDVFEYNAFKLILAKLAHEYPTCKFGFPRIGSGLAGGDEAAITMMIESFSRVVAKTGGTVTIVEFQP